MQVSVAVLYSPGPGKVILEGERLKTLWVLIAPRKGVAFDEGLLKVPSSMLL